jgi:hypothetical protein
MSDQVSAELCTLSVDSVSASDAIVISPAGGLRCSACSQMRRAIQVARNMGKQVSINLTEVTLIDRRALAFLCLQLRDNVDLTGCPLHLERWIMSEQAGSQKNARRSSHP